MFLGRRWEDRWNFERWGKEEGSVERNDLDIVVEGEMERMLEVDVGVVWLG